MTQRESSVKAFEDAILAGRVATRFATEFPTDEALMESGVPRT